MPETFPVAPTLIPLEGPMRVGDVQLMLSRYDLREPVVFGYPVEGSDAYKEKVINPDNEPRYRYLAAGLMSYDRKLRELTIYSLPPRVIELTGTEHKLFDMLATNEGSVVPRVTLGQAASCPEISSHRVDVHIANIRKKLGEDYRRYIRVVRGVGFIVRPENLD